MELLTDHGRRISLEDLNTSKLLAHASRQARQRNYDDMVIVDVDSHHYENEHMREIVPFMENDILKQLVTNAAGRGRLNLFPNHSGFTDMGGRVTRYPLRPSEKTDSNGKHREIQLGHRWMDAMGVDYACLFPTGMLSMGQTPQKEIEQEATWAYSRWLTEKVIPESGGRICSALPLPFANPAACLRHVETFGDRKGVVGFMVTTVRHQPVYDDAYMSTYRAIEERGLTLSFHAGNNWGEQVFKSCNRFMTVHALGFSFYNMLHLSNWVVNGMGERFPKLPVIWIEFGPGVAAVPDAAARPRVHAAAVGSPAAQEEAVGLHARHVLLVATDGARGHDAPRADVPRHRRGKPSALFIGLSALGLRSALDHL